MQQPAKITVLEHPSLFYQQPTHYFIITHIPMLYVFTYINQMMHLENDRYTVDDLRISSLISRIILISGIKRILLAG
jgi:hypothetical protein